MRANPDDHRPTLSVRINDGLGDGPQGLDGEDVRQAAIELSETPPLLPRFGEISHAYLTVPFLQWIGLEIRYVDRRNKRTGRRARRSPARTFCQGAVPL